LYENIEGSGITTSKKVKADDVNWRSNGTLVKFDQYHIIDLISSKYKEAAGAGASVDPNFHGL